MKSLYFLAVRKNKKTYLLAGSYAGFELINVSSLSSLLAEFVRLKKDELIKVGGLTIFIFTSIKKAESQRKTLLGIKDVCTKKFFIYKLEFSLIS